MREEEKRKRKEKILTISTRLQIIIIRNMSVAKQTSIIHHKLKYYTSGVDINFII